MGVGWGRGKIPQDGQQPRDRGLGPDGWLGRQGVTGDTSALSLGSPWRLPGQPEGWVGPWLGLGTRTAGGVDSEANNHSQALPETGSKALDGAGG